MGKGTRENKSKGKHLSKSKDKKKRKRKVIIKKKVLAKVLAKLLTKHIDSPSSNSESDDEMSSDNSSPPCYDSPSPMSDCLSLGNMSPDSGEVLEGGVGGRISPSTALSSPKSAEQGEGGSEQINLPSCPPSPSSVSKEGEWIVENHAHSPSNVHIIDVEPDRPVNSVEDTDPVLIVTVDDDEVQSLLLSSDEDRDVVDEPRGVVPVAPFPVPSTSASSSDPTPGTSASIQGSQPDNQSVPSPGLVTTSTVTDSRGVTKLFFDPKLSPFVVRNQMVDLGLHNHVDFDLQIIKESTSRIRPCLPYQNDTCHRLVPTHGSQATNLVFTHVCLLCLYRERLPLPHPMVRCPFAIAYNPNENP